MFKKIFKWLKFKAVKIIYPENIKITGLCLKCGKCCKTILIYSEKSNYDNQAVFIKTIDEFEKQQKEVPFYKNLIISGKNSQDELYFKCRYLVDDRCSVYKLRPDFCKDYPSVKMFTLGGSLHNTCGYKITAKKPFKYYLDNNL